MNEVTFRVRTKVGKSSLENQLSKLDFDKIPSRFSPSKLEINTLQICRKLRKLGTKIFSQLLKVGPYHAIAHRHVPSQRIYIQLNITFNEAIHQN